MYVAFHHGGRYGDLVYSLWSARTLRTNAGKTKFFLSDYHSPGWSKRHVETCLSFLEYQEYIDEAVFYDSSRLGEGFHEEGFDKIYDLHYPERIRNPEDFPYWDSSLSWPGNVNLADRTATYFNLKYNPNDKWISAPLSPAMCDVVIHYIERRATRPLEDVERLIDGLTDAGVQVGLVGRPEELSWTKYHDTHLLHCKDLLELARVVGNSPRFYGVASCPLALAVSMNVPVLVDIQRGCEDILPLPGGGRDTTRLSIEEIQRILT